MTHHTPNPQAVLFDMDGTLIDSEGLWWIAECEVMESLGGTWTPADQQHCLGGPLERVGDYMADKVGADLTGEEIGTRLIVTMERLMRSEPLEWRPGAAELVRSCQSAEIPLALVSASYRQLLHAVSDVVAQETGGHPFDVSVAGDEVSVSKPHPEPYLTAAQRLGVSIEQCVVIEDSPTGVASGQASGAFVVAVPHMVPILAAPRRIVIESLEGVTVADLAAWLAEADR